MEPVPCEAPYVSPTPVFVPSFVEFTVRSITGDSAAVRVTRRDPDTGEWLPPQDFNVGIGKKIGGMRTLKIKLPPQLQIPGMPTQYQG